MARRNGTKHETNPTPDAGAQVNGDHGDAAPADAAALDAQVVAQLKIDVADAMREVDAVAESLQLAKERLADAEHALCERVVRMRKGDKKHVEIEIDGANYKPKLAQESKRYRLDRAPSTTRFTI